MPTPVGPSSSSLASSFDGIRPARAREREREQQMPVRATMICDIWPPLARGPSIHAGGIRWWGPRGDQRMSATENGVALSELEAGEVGTWKATCAGPIVLPLRRRVPAPLLSWLRWQLVRAEGAASGDDSKLLLGQPVRSRRAHRGGGSGPGSLEAGCKPREQVACPPMSWLPAPSSGRRPADSREFLDSQLHRPSLCNRSGVLSRRGAGPEGAHFESRAQHERTERRPADEPERTTTTTGRQLEKLRTLHNNSLAPAELPLEVATRLEVETNPTRPPSLLHLVQHHQPANKWPAVTPLPAPQQSKRAKIQREASKQIGTNMKS